MAAQHLSGSEIFVVDDDEAMRDTLSAMLSPEGCRVTCFAEGQAFLAAARSRTPACVLLDVNMPGRSGLEVLRELDALRYPAPVLMVSGQRDVPTAVDAIKSGALDFIEKPIEACAVIARVRDAIRSFALRMSNGRHGEVMAGHRLTAREQDVLHQVVAGASNKEAGRFLGISPRTVEVHRARVMEKLGAKNAADLVRIVLGSASSH